MLSRVLMPRERVPGSSASTCTLTRTKTSSVISLARTTSARAASKRCSLQAGSHVSMPMMRSELTSRR